MIYRMYVTNTEGADGWHELYYLEQVIVSVGVERLKMMKDAPLSEQ